MTAFATAESRLGAAVDARSLYAGIWKLDPVQREAREVFIDKALNCQRNGGCHTSYNLLGRQV